MKILYKIEEFEKNSQPICLTIGNFDGVHIGHQAILSKLKHRKVVFTFSNHPMEVLKGRPFYYLTSVVHRLQLLEHQGVDTTILIPFTIAFSEKSPEIFLQELRKFVPFSHLVLGHDAVIGYEQRGDRPYLLHLSQQMGFKLEYHEPVLQNASLVSSSEIRKQIQLGNFKQASQLLGRPYSILTTVESGSQQGRLLGYRTANLKVYNLCLPPLGVYIVKAIINGKAFKGVANLGQAPTLHANRPPLLEVHLLDFDGELYQKPVEVIFQKFIRNEKKFSSIEELKAQIQNDVESALSYSKETSY